MEAFLHQVGNYYTNGPTRYFVRVLKYVPTYLDLSV